MPALYNLFIIPIQTISESGCTRKISQMPVVLVPLHFDRDPANRIPSCARSIVLRPFLSNDFMTGVPIIPGSPNLPTAVNLSIIVCQFKIYYSEFSLLHNRLSIKWSEAYAQLTASQGFYMT